MTIRLKRKESVAQGLQRIARDEFDAVEAAVRALAEPDERSKAFHDIRKHLKIIRALYRFWGDALPSPVRAAETARLSEIARDFSAARDLDVKMAALHSISIDGREPILEQWVREREQRTEVASHPESVQKHIAALTVARQHFSTLPNAPGGWPFLSLALTRSYRRARAGFRVAVSHATDDLLLHEWRKRAKVLEYQVTFLQKSHPNVKALSERLHRLTECLGLQHDLITLAAGLREGHGEFLETIPGHLVLKQIDTRRAKLWRQGVRLGDRLFAHKSKAFVASLHRRWRDWR